MGPDLTRGTVVAKNANAASPLPQPRRACRARRWRRLRSAALAAGAPRGALSITTAGWWPGTVAVGAGDHIGPGGRLYMATEKVVASGAGTATIPIAPPLREAMLASAPLVLTRPSVPMRLVSDDEAANPTRPGRFTAITIRMEEAL